MEFAAKKLNILNYCFLRNTYIILMVCALCMRSVGIYSLMPSKIDSLFFSIVGTLGIAVLFIGIIQKKILISKKNMWLLSLYLIILLISSILNFKYGFFGNFKHIVWTAIAFFILFADCKKSGKNSGEKLFYQIQNILIIFFLVLSFLSVVTFIFQTNHVKELNNFSIKYFYFGFVDGRLYGMFVNPNYGGMISLLTVIFSIGGLFSNSKYRLSKWICISNIVIQSIYIILAYSRGTIFAFLSLASMGIFIYFFQSKLLKNNKVMKIISSIIISAAFYFMLNFSINAIRFLLSYLPNLIHGVLDRVSISRKDILNNMDISNMRYSIWFSAFEIFKRNWFFGISPGNVLAYAKEVMPETFIAVKEYTKMHNAYISIATYTGVCGVFVMFWFFLRNFFGVITPKFIKNFLKEPKILFFKINTEAIVAISNLFCVAIYGLVESEILFVNTVCSLVFWISFNQLVFHTEKFEVTK